MSSWNNFLIRNSVPELDHVANVSIVLNETAASDRVSCSYDAWRLTRPIFILLQKGFDNWRVNTWMLSHRSDKNERKCPSEEIRPHGKRPTKGSETWQCGAPTHRCHPILVATPRDCACQKRPIYVKRDLPKQSSFAKQKLAISLKKSVRCRHIARQWQYQKTVLFKKRNYIYE